MGSVIIENELYKATIAELGENHQKVKACEELAELQQALIKDILNGKGSGNVPEEIADVEILIGQLKLMYDPRIINEYKRFKLKRLEQIILRK